MSDDLIKRLSDPNRDWFEFGHDRREAADRIEQLVAINEQLVATCEELLEERERVIKASNDMFCVMSDSLNTAHAKLAKAVEALRVISQFNAVTNSALNVYNIFKMTDRAHTVLAELEGKE